MKNNATLKLKQKELALTQMKKLDIYKDYIDIFKENDTVTYFDRFIGFWAYQDKELFAKIKEIERKYGCLVYAITHEYMVFGECYSFLIISKYKEEWDKVIETENNIHYTLAYVWNKTDDDCSEFGTIGVKSALGGIRRVA